MTERESCDASKRDSGIAMIMVLLWSVLLLAIALAVTVVALRQIQPSDASEKSYAALAAAEAGIEDYLVRLRQPGYESTIDPSNPAFTSFVPVPGGATAGEFTYAVDTSRARSGGEIRVYSTGRSGGIERTVEAVLSRRTPLDYVYLSDIETPSPEVPGSYSTRAGTGGNTTTTARQLAEALCSRRWYEAGQVGPNGQVGNQRNIRYCQWAGIYASERIFGRIHTNDVWVLENADLSQAIQVGAISSSCRSEAEGIVAGEVGCPANHRYIASNTLSSGRIVDRTWTSQTSTYQGDSYRPSGAEVTRRNPRYEPPLELPTAAATAAKFKVFAAESGCIFTGPTRIRFDVVAGRGVAYVTSPDTKQTGTGCGTGYAATTGAPTSQQTRMIYLDQFDDLVIFIQDLPLAGVDDPSNPLDVANVWAAGTAPTCQIKTYGTTSSPYPYVVPNVSADSGEAALFSATSRPEGFPSAYADPTNAWYASNCGLGDVYVQGTAKGRVTVAAENNIVLTGSLRDSTAQSGGTDNGKPAASSQTSVGMVAGQFAYLYRPLTSTTSSPAWVTDWRTSNASDPVLNAAILAVDQCFGAQDAEYGSRNGSIYLWGSLSQKYRCIVGFTGGYSKSYKYDDRLTWQAPPYFVALFDEPWEVRRWGEVTPRQQAPGTTEWELPLSPGESVIDAQVVFGDASVTQDGVSASVTARSDGQVIVRYRVSTASGFRYRHLVILVASP
ncbi:MAG: hypothetical protein RL134_1010 [Actinomycetota bacterium]|jgi:hypothetical protein